jgi:hypothetical protein
MRIAVEFTSEGIQARIMKEKYVVLLFEKETSQSPAALRDFKSRY